MAEAVVELLAPVRERYAELRPDEAALEAILAAGAEKARAIAAPIARRRARAHGRRARKVGRKRRRFVPALRTSLPGMAIAELELDLDVFAGPFDLLLALVLREEVDLLEVELAEVVVAYVEHLEREGELELEVATEFLVLIAALLELKSRLMLPGAEDELDELEPGGGGRGAARADARVPPLPRRRRRARRPLREPARLPLPLGAAAARAAPRRGRGRRPPSTTPTCSAPRSATC